MFLPNSQPAQSFTGDSLTLQPCEKAGISHDIWVTIFLLAKSLENCKIFCLKQREFHPTFCRNVQRGEKKKKKEDRRQFCIFQGTSVKGYENSGVLFESADVLLSSLQSSTAPHRYHKCNGLNHPCFSFLGSLLRHSTLLLNNQS